MKSKTLDAPAAARSATKLSAAPLAAALRASGDLPLCPIAVARHKENERRRQSSHSLWIFVATKVIRPFVRRVVHPAAAVLIVAGLVLAVALAVSGGAATCLAAFVGYCVFVCLVMRGSDALMFLSGLLTFRIAEWRTAHYARDLAPAWVHPIVGETVARVPDVAFEIETLVVDDVVVDPVLVAVLGDERYPLAVWDERGRRVPILAAP